MAEVSAPVAPCISPFEDVQIRDLILVGLQCHTAPFSWKLVFECDHQLYEIIMTACTPKEELEWRSRLSRTGKEGQEQKDANLYSSLSLNIKSLGTVFGKPGWFFRVSPGGLPTNSKPHRHHRQENIDTSSNYGRPEIASVPGHTQEHERSEGRSDWPNSLTY